MTATEDDVPTGRIVNKDAKRFLNLVVGSFLAVTNVDDIKQRLIYIEVLDKTS